MIYLKLEKLIIRNTFRQLKTGSMVTIFNVDFFVLSAGNEDIAFSQVGLKYL